MIAIVNNFRRMFFDNGQNDRSFDAQEKRLQTARAGLLKEADGLKRAAEALADLIRGRAAP